MIILKIPGPMSGKSFSGFARYRPVQIVIVAGFMMFSSLGLAKASPNLSLLSKAINNYVCYGSFWENDKTFAIGRVVDFVARQENNTTYVWSDDFMVVTPQVRQWTVFLSVISKGDRSKISEIVGVNTGDNNPGMRETSNFKMLMSQVFANGAVSFKLQLPNNCAPPKFLPDNGLKRRTFSILLNSLTKQFDLEMKYLHGVHYPQDVKVVVANFNVDDAYTFVWVPSKNEIYSVGIYSEDDPFTNICLKYDDCQVLLDNAEGSDGPELIHKILKYGRVFWIRS